MTKKRSLGRGIGNFLSSEENIAQIINSDKERNFLYIDINLIERNSDQPRKVFDKKSLDELAESIKIME